MPTQIKLSIVEDWPDVVELLKQTIMFLHPDCEILTAFTAQEGLLSAWRHNPDLIIIDLSLPDMDGDEMTHALRERNRSAHIPIIGMSALYVGDSQTLNFKKLCDCFLEKPFKIGELEVRLKALLPAQVETPAITDISKTKGQYSLLF